MTNVEDDADPAFACNVCGILFSFRRGTDIGGDGDGCPCILREAEREGHRMDCVTPFFFASQVVEPVFFDEFLYRGTIKANDADELFEKARRDETTGFEDLKLLSNLTM